MDECTVKLFRVFKAPKGQSKVSVVTGRISTPQFIEQCKKINAHKASSPFTPSLLEMKVASEDWEVVEVDACLTSLAILTQCAPKP